MGHRRSGRGTGGGELSLSSFETFIWHRVSTIRTPRQGTHHPPPDKRL